MRGGRGDAPLVGRDSELATLDCAFDRVPTGRAALVFLEGEPGIGKTRLLDEALRLVDPSTVRVLRAAGREVERTRPFGLIADALGLDPSSPDPSVAQTARLLLREGDVIRETVDAKAGPSVRYRVVEAVVELTERMALAGPLVLALEDLHWADPSTLLTLHTLARRLRDLPLCLVGTFRPAAISRELDRVVEALVGEGAVHAVLRPLDWEDVAALATAVAGAPPGPRLQEHLKRAEGNPLFVVELIRALSDERLLIVTSGHADLTRFFLPPGLRLVLLRQFSHLSPETLEVLKVASVLGSSFEVARLALVIRRSAVELTPPLQEALRTGLLRDIGTRLAFRHDLIREAMYEDMPGPLRVGLHREAAQVLLDAGAMPVEVVEHVLLGAQRGDRRALAWLSEAARDILSLSPASAVELIERALALADSDDSSRDALLADLVVARMWSGDIRQAEELAREILSRPTDPAVSMTVRSVLVDALTLQGRVLEANRECRLAVREPALPGAGRAQLRALAAVEPLYAGDMEGAAAAGEEALREAEQFGDDRAVCAALGVLGLTALVQGHVREAITRLEASLRRAHQSRSKAAIRSVYSPYILLGLALAEGDRLEEAVELFQEGLRVSDELGFTANLPLFHWGLAQFLFLSGSWDDALAEAEAGFSCGNDVGSGMGSMMTHVVVALIAFHRNQLRRTAEALIRAEAALALGPQPVFDFPELGRALLLESAGDTQGALVVLKAGWERHVAGSVLLDHPFLGPDLVRLLLAAGDVETATAMVEQVEEAGRRLDTPSARGAALRCRAMLEPESQLLLQAVAVLREGPRPLDRAVACEEAATAVSRASPSAESITLLEEAHQIYEKVRAVRDVARVEARLRSLGVHGGKRTPRRGRSTRGWESLTRTEMEVVRLVAQGSTNREVAERLYISRRTVETHLSHVFGKLGLSSRSALRGEVGRRSAGMHAQDANGQPPRAGAHER